MESIHLVEISDIPQIQEEGVLIFTIPNDSLIYEARASYIRYVDSTDYTWSGKIDYGLSSILIVSNPDGKAGYVQTTGATYHILPIRNKLSLFIKYNELNEEEQTLLCGNIGENEIASFECQNNGCAATINILILVNENVQAVLPTGSQRNLLLFSMIETLNQAFENSDISHRAIGTYVDVNWIWQDQNMCEDADLLAESPSIIDIRNQYKGDLVLLLTAETYDGDYYGCVSEIGPNNSAAFGIFRVDKILNNNRLFIHEIGHLLGGQHERNRPDELCNHAWDVFFLTGKLGTAICSACHRTINQFSNPEIHVYGLQTGSDQENNAGRIREVGCEIAAFQGTQQMATIINGPGILCSDPPYLFTAEVEIPPIGTPGQPPYTYEWYWNTSGIFTIQQPGQYLGNTETISISSPPFPSPCEPFFLQVKAESSDHIESSSIKSVNSCLACSPPLPGSRILKTPKNLVCKTTTFMEIFPNPTKGQFTVHYILDSPDKVRIDIVDLLGNHIQTNNLGILPKGNQSTEIILINHKKGPYLLKLTSGRFTTTDIFFIQ